jgi:hypothetical protein
MGARSCSWASVMGLYMRVALRRNSRACDTFASSISKRRDSLGANNAAHISHVTVIVSRDLL